MPDTPSTDAFLASLVNSSDDAILSKNLNGIITSWNKGAERMFGYTADETIGQPVTMLFPEDRVDEEPSILARIVNGERVDHFETVRRCKDGRLIDISLTISPIFGPDGGVIGASKVARNITEQRSEQERLVVTLASIGDAVISTDEEGRVVFMNAVAERLTGWRGSEAKGRPMADVFKIINETTRVTVASPVDKVLKDGVTVGLANHTVLIAKEGEEWPIEDSAAPICDRSGRVIGVVLVFRDATARRDADLAALRLAAIIEGSDDAIISKDLNGIIRSWNPGAERVFGYRDDEVIGQAITRLIPSDRIEEEQQILKRLQRGERVDHFMTRRVRKDGKEIDVSLTISPIRDAEGHVVGASKIARDITELKVAHEKLEAYATELEQKVRERTARLEATVDELEAFSYSLSHDMRAPLRAIHSFTELVLEDYGERLPEAGDYLRRVIAAAARMDRLIADVLSFTRLARVEIAVAPVDVDTLVRELIEEQPALQPPLADVSVEGTLPAVLGHEASLVQCLANLLNNAVKFVDAGVTPRVVVFAKPSGDRVKICVRDNGIGISPEDQRRLFKVFQRLHSSDRYDGTGVGLAIVRKAAERMGGSAGIESSRGQGSTFWVELSRA